MVVMIKYELKKIVQKRILWVCIMVLVAYCAFFFVDNVNPFGTNLSIIKPDGTVITGLEAVKYEKEVANKYKGRLDADKMIRIVDEFSLNKESFNKAIQSGTSWKQNFTYGSIERLILKEGKNIDYMSILKTIFPSLKEITIGYSKPWGATIEAIRNDTIFLGFVLIIALSSVFAEEYSSGMSELLLTSKLGRTKNGVVCSKIITAYVICLVLWLLIIMINILPTLFSVGTEGLECSVQLVYPYSFQFLQAELKLGTLLGYTCFLTLCSMISVTALTLFQSAYSDNSFSTLVKGVAIYLFPAMIYDTGSTNLFLFLLPLLQLDHSTVFSMSRINLVDRYVFAVWGVILIDVLYLLLSNKFVFKRFSQHRLR